MGYAPRRFFYLTAQAEHRARKIVFMKKTLVWVVIAACIPAMALKAQESNAFLPNEPAEVLPIYAQAADQTVSTPHDAPQVEVTTPVDSNQLSDQLMNIGMPATPVSDSSLYEQGKLDAARYYDKRNTGAGGTFCTSFLLSPILGVIPAIACSAKPPKLENLKYPNSELMKDAEYVRGYTEQAHSMKKKKVWGSFGAGTAAYIAFVAIAYSLN